MSSRGIFSKFSLIYATLFFVATTKFKVFWTWSLTVTKETSLLEIFHTSTYNFIDLSKDVSLLSMYLSNNSSLVLNWSLDPSRVFEKAYYFTWKDGPFIFICFFFLVTSISSPFASVFCIFEVFELPFCSISITSKKLLLLVI